MTTARAPTRTRKSEANNNVLRRVSRNRSNPCPNCLAKGWRASSPRSVDSAACGTARHSQRKAGPSNPPPLLAIAGPVPQARAVTPRPARPIEDAGGYAPDGRYSFSRLGLALLISTLVGAGMWAIIVVMPEAQREFGVDRAAASFPYTLMMCTLAFSTIALGRMTDRLGIVLPLVISGSSLGLGFVLAGYAPNLTVFSVAHVLIGVGAGTGFGPMMADISHWFVKRRGLAVVVVASGNYFAGTIWPLLMSFSMPLIGWRATYAGLGLIVAFSVLPLALAMRRRPSAAVLDEAEAATAAARADVG